MLKTWLIWQGIPFRPVHNVEVLLKQCEQDDLAFAQLREAEHLTPYAVEVRYGDDFYLPTREETGDAARVAGEVEAFVLAKFAAAGINPVRQGAAGAPPQGGSPAPGSSGPES